jgi:hypothetical protein
MKTENTMATLLGGEMMEVTTLKGEKEQVKVCQLPISLFQAYLDSTDDEPRLISLLTGKPADWVDTLAPESCVALIEKGEGINGDFFGQWFRRKLARQQKLMGEVPESLKKIGLSASPNTSPK